MFTTPVEYVANTTFRVYGFVAIDTKAPLKRTALIQQNQIV